MSSTTTFDTIAAILQKDFRLAPDQIHRESALSDLGLDSLALMEFVFAVEDAFALRIPQERLDPRAAGLSLDHLCAVIDELRAENAPQARAA